MMIGALCFELSSCLVIFVTGFNFYYETLINLPCRLTPISTSLLFCVQKFTCLTEYETGDKAYILCVH